MAIKSKSKSTKQKPKAASQSITGTYIAEDAMLIYQRRCRLSAEAMANHRQRCGDGQEQQPDCIVEVTQLLP